MACLVMRSYSQEVLSDFLSALPQTSLPVLLFKSGSLFKAGTKK